MTDKLSQSDANNLLADKDRLDFLGRAPDNVRFIVYPLQPFDGDWCCVQALEHYRNSPGGFRTIRDAIDSAMENTKCKEDK